MIPEEPIEACRNCGREFPVSELDANGWCPDCKRAVVRRATLWGRGAGMAAALVLAVVIATGIGPSPRFPLVAWLVLIAAVYLFFMKVARRVAFELILSRAVPAERS